MNVEVGLRRCVEKHLGREALPAGQGLPLLVGDGQGHGRVDVVEVHVELAHGLLHPGLLVVGEIGRLDVGLQRRQVGLHHSNDETE